jgi:hypothetical protein
MISNLVNKTWFSHYLHGQYIIYDNGIKFELHFKALCESLWIKPQPASVENPQVNAILEWLHQVIVTMLHTTELDMANTVETSDIDAFLTDAAWAICSHTVLKATWGTEFFGWDMLFGIPECLAVELADDSEEITGI